MITAFMDLLWWRRHPPSVRSDVDLHGFALEALERLVETWRSYPAEMGGAKAVPIILDICAREGLTEGEFHGMANHFTAATVEFTDNFWAAHLRDAAPAGRA